MKTMLLTLLAFASLCLTSCEMGDIDVNDFLNDMTIGDPNGEDQDTGYEGYCGDGIIQWDMGETCDDGNSWWGDGCNEYCWVEYGWYCPTPGKPCYWNGNPGYCGDGIVQPEIGEQCDDGNWNDGDGCSSWCTLESYAYYTCTYDGVTYAVGDWWWVSNYEYCYCDGWEEIVCYQDYACGK